MRSLKKESMKNRILLASFVATTAALYSALAQCEPQWLRYGSQTGVDRPVLGLTMFDPDGTGPQPASPVAVGEFSLASGLRAEGVARWNGSAWESMDWPFGPQVQAVSLWDADGEGPLAERVVVAANGSVLEYSDGSWRPLGPYGSGRISAMTSWRDGPTTKLLAVGGFSLQDGEAQVRNVGVWDGTSWAPVGEGVNGPVQSVVLWDADGNGPDPLRPVIAGEFSASGAQPLQRVGVWGGESWLPLGAGLGANARSLCLWDPDGAGPERERLVAAGDTNPGTSSVLSSWDGQSWSALVPPVTGRANWVHAFDHDRDPATADQLIVSADSAMTAGSVVGATLLWDGSTWRSLGAMQGGIRSAVLLEIDDGDVVRNELLVGGAFAQIDGRRFDHIAVWRGASWDRMGLGPDGRVTDLLPWDPDGAGPRQQVLAVSGAFTAIDRSAGGYAASWNGTEWTSDVGPDASPIGRLALWDPDQSGSQPPVLIGARSYTSPNGSTSSRMVRWNGASWEQMGTYRGQSSITAVGPSPQISGPNSLYFASQGGTFPLSRFNGTDWVEAFAVHGTRVVSSIIVGDPDGSGPFSSGLLFSGTGVYRATGLDTTLIPGSPSSISFSGIFDVDGVGSLPPVMVVGGAFPGCVSYYRNNTWTVLGGGLSGGGSPVVYALEAWDPDGAGPAHPLLVAAGEFTRAGGVPVRSLAAWNGEAWQSLAGGVGGRVYAMRKFTHHGRTDLAVAGEFADAGGLPTSSIAFLKPAGLCCPADFNADGFLDFFDYADFVACFEGTQCPDPDPLAADFNADGFVDFFDYADFVEALETGC